MKAADTRRLIEQSHWLIRITDAACDRSRAAINQSRAVLVEIRATRQGSATWEAGTYLLRHD